MGMAGCGGSGGGQVDARTTLLVPDPPTAAEAGAYLAVQRGYDETEGVRLNIEPDRKQLDLDRDEAAIVPATALAHRRDLVAVMAVTQGRDQLVLAVPSAALDDRAAVGALVRALQRGYTEALADPESAVAAQTEEVDGADRGALQAELDRIAPSFTAGAREFGALDAAALKARGVQADGSLVGPVSRD